jgi:hypothetical protein
MTHKIDVSKGQCIGTVSAQWASRPDDQKFTSLSALHEQVTTWADESSAVNVLPADIEVLYDGEDHDTLRLQVAGAEVVPTHWSFDTICRAASAPSNYMRSLPAPLAAVNLNYGLKTADPKEVSAYIRQNGTTTLRGITSTRYGRILDRDVVEAVRRIAGNGTGDTRWKVPGCIDWRSEFGVTYNPNVDITKQNTTLYASDRDVFLFLVDDRNPIEVGKLDDGSPDLMFRGFYVWNSEVGSKTFGFASMYLRGVCQNRNLWGVEGFSELTFKHTASAPDRFIEQAIPALELFSDAGTTKLIAGVQAAKGAIVAKNDEDRLDFLSRYGFSERAAKRIITTVEAEEGHLPTSVWDFAQGITAAARAEEYQEARIAMEQIAGRMLDKVKA